VNTCPVRDAFPSWDVKSFWMMYASTTRVRVLAWRFLPDFPTRFFFHVPFSSPRRTEMMMARWRTLSIDSTAGAILRIAPFAFLSFWIFAWRFYRSFAFFSISRDRGRKRSSPAVREFFSCFLRGFLHGFRSAETLIVRRRSIARRLTRHDTYLFVVKIYFDHLFPV